MTVASQLAQRNQRFDYILCIEGAGWPVDWFDLSQGFAGDLFVNNDLNGDLASLLGATIHHGMEPQSGVSEEIDPVTLVWTLSSMSFEIKDVDGWWLANHTPRASGIDDTLAADLDFADVAVDLTTAAHSDGTAIWIANRELVLLGGLAAGVYATSTRGYLGTRQGSVVRDPAANTHGHWSSGTSTTTNARWWNGRKMALFAHVPGEAAANCELRWFGKLRGVAEPTTGEVGSLSGVGDFM